MHKTACVLFLIAFSSSAQQLQPLGIGLEAVPYPWPVRYMPLTIENQEVRMAFMDIPAMANPSGRVAVLMHGKNFGGYYFNNVANMLSAAGYRVIVPDQIGWGRSSKPDIHYTFNMLAENTAKLLDTLGIDRVTVLGHSTGGMLAVRFALMYPQRTSALILEDPLGLEDYRVGPAQTLEETYRNELKKTPDTIRATFVVYFATARPDLWEPLADIPVRVLLSGEYPRWAKASALASMMIVQQPVRYEYKDLRPPVLIIVGDKDHTAPVSPKASPEQRAKMGNFVELAHAAVKDIPHGEAVIIENCGHIPHLEKPEEFRAALLKFLNTTH